MILSYNGGLPSCKILRDEIFKLTEKKILITTNPDKIKGTLHFRWGNSANCYYAEEELNVNSPKFIHVIADKYILGKYVNMARVPEFKKLREEMPEKFPVIIRSNLRASRGEGIEGVVNSIEELLEKFSNIDYFWTYFYKSKKEYRIHVAGGEILKVFIKKPKEGIEEPAFPIRHNKDYKFSLIDFDREREEGKYQKMEETVNEFWEKIALPLNGFFFALDVLWSSEINNYVILEANSAPGLNEKTASLYAKKIVERIF